MLFAKSVTLNAGVFHEVQGKGSKYEEQDK